MPRRAANITQADIARGIRAMKQAGYDPEVVIQQHGAVVVLRPFAGAKPDEISTALDTTQRPRL
jgi:hypothetical protein